MKKRNIKTFIATYHDPKMKWVTKTKEIVAVDYKTAKKQLVEDDNIPAELIISIKKNKR